MIRFKMETNFFSPRSEPELQEILKMKRQVAVVGNDSCRAIPMDKTPELIITTSNLNQIRHDASEFYVTAQAGARFSDIDKKLSEHGQELFYPVWHERATIGGIIASNAFLAFGNVKDFILGSRIVTASGNIIRSGGIVAKNVSGLDLSRLFVGSMGNYVIYTEITLRTRPKKQLYLHKVTDFSQLKEFSSPFIWKKDGVYHVYSEKRSRKTGVLPSFPCWDTVYSAKLSKSEILDALFRSDEMMCSLDSLTALSKDPPGILLRNGTRCMKDPIGLKDMVDPDNIFVGRCLG